jgi:hypothetical protein
MTHPSIEDRLAVTDAIHRFFHLVDSGHAAETADLFTDNARLTFGPGSPQPGTIEGPAIRSAMIARQAQASAFTRHTVANIRISSFDAELKADYLLTLFRSDDETRSSMPAFIADVSEIWVRQEWTWRIGERTITPAFYRS